MNLIRFFLLLLCILILIPGARCREEPVDPEAAIYGTVVYNYDEEPVNRGEVKLYECVTEDLVVTVKTNSDGTYTIYKDDFPQEGGWFSIYASDGDMWDCEVFKYDPSKAPVKIDFYIGDPDEYCRC